jgi:hypothetical protein
MNSEIIQNVANDNYDDFQHVKLLFSQKNSFHYLKINFTILRIN